MSPTMQALSGMSKNSLQTPVLYSHIHTRLQNLGGCAAKAFHLGFVVCKAASEIKMSSTLIRWPVVDVDSLNNLSYLGWGWLSSSKICTTATMRTDPSSPHPLYTPCQFCDGAEVYQSSLNVHFPNGEVNWTFVLGLVFFCDRSHYTALAGQGLLM